MCAREETDAARSDEAVREEERRKISRFLLRAGFEMPLPCLYVLAESLRRQTEGKYRIQDVYATAGDRIRTQIAYYAKSQYAKVRNTIKETFGADIGAYYEGNKVLVRKLASVYFFFEKQSD